MDLIDKSKSNIVIRLDASKEIGLGHLVRCLNLIKVFPDIYNYIFVIRKSEEQTEIIDLIKNSRYSVILLSESLTLIEDIAQTNSLIQGHGAVAFINDLITYDCLNYSDYIYKYTKAIKKQNTSCITITFGDSRIINYYCDLVIIQNEIRENSETNYNNKLGIVLYGSKYLISHPNYQNIDIANRVIRSKAKNIVISIGGSDPFKLTNKLVETLSLMKGVCVRVLIGLNRSQEDRAFFKKIESESPFIKFLEFTENVGEELYNADVAIVGEGNIKFEAALTGTPSLLITQFDHNSDPINYFREQNVSVYAGRGDNYDGRQFLAILIGLMNNKEKRKELSGYGLAKYTSNGAENIYKEFIKPLIEKTI